MQPNSDEWQQPAEPITSEPHSYTAPPPVAAVEQPAPQEPSAPQPREGDEEVVRWQATEYIQRDKDVVWFIWFALVAIALVAIALFVIRSVTFAILIPVMAAALIVYVRRPPTVFDYTLSRQGLHINDRLYGFGDFKEFGLIRGDDENAVLLVPRKRFQPGVTVYFPEEAGEAVVDLLAARLPMHEVQLDPIDRLIRFLRI